MERGGNSVHKFILFLNVLTLFLLILFVSLKNVEVSFGLILLGFSPSILSILINAVIEKKITEGYHFLFIPFIVTALFILFGILYLGNLTKSMDFESLSTINFMYTLIFSFLYYFSTKTVKTKIKKQVIHQVPKPTPKKENVVPPKTETVHIQVEKVPKEVIHTHHVIHHEENEEDKPPKVSKENPYIKELKKEFNIINIDHTKIMESLSNLAVKKHNKDLEIHEILDNLEKSHIYFASNTGEKYHKPLCIVINHISHEKIVAFESEEEAKNKGYKPCAVCMPR
jgi:hypothetical protein